MEASASCHRSIRVPTVPRRGAERFRFQNFGKLERFCGDFNHGIRLDSESTSSVIQRRVNEADDSLLD